MDIDKSLISFYKSIRPSKNEHRLRLLALETMQSKIKEIYPSASLHTFGSFHTGLYLSSSDIDISLDIPIESNKVLKDIRKHFIECGIVTNIVHIQYARIPILKFKDKKYKFKFDISVNNKGGCYTASFVKELVDKHEYIKMIVVILKYTLSIRKMSDASTGGLNSYSQFLLIYNYFQLHPLINLENASICKIQENLFVCFVDLIQYYGFIFKYKKVQVDCKNLKYKVNVHNRLSIIDPTDHNVDVGGCCKNMDIVISLFQNLYRSVLYYTNGNAKWSIRDILTK